MAHVMVRTKLVIAINSTWNFINFRAGLMRALADYGYELVAVAPDDGHAAALGGLGLRYVPVALERRRTSVAGELRLLWQYRAILRAERPAAQLTFTIKPNIYGSLAARTLGIPTIGNVAGLGTTFLEAGPLNRAIRGMYRLALKPNPVTFFQNAEDRALFVKDGIVLADRTRLLPGSGVDLKRFVPSPARTDRKEGGPVFLMIARLLWAKGVNEYAAAARAIRARHPEARFRLIGMQEDSRGAVPLAVLRQWHDAQIIEFLGESNDVRPAIADADCVVLPSFYPEGTPRVLLEAAAIGRPLITTDLPGCRNVVVHGRNGYLVAPRDVLSLEAAFERFIALEPATRLSMGAASRRLAEGRFDETFVIDAYAQALAEIVPRT